MGRLRSKYAKNDTDRNALEHLEKAESFLVRAAEVYQTYLKTLPSDERRKVHTQMHLVNSAISAIKSVRPLQSRIDMEDEDLLGTRRKRRRGER